MREQDLLDVVDSALDRLDEPLADPSYLPTYLLSRLAATHVKVVLGGDGGDELWGGYPTYRAHDARAPLRRLPPSLRDRVLAPLIARLPDRRSLPEPRVEAPPLHAALRRRRRDEASPLDVVRRPARSQRARCRGPPGIVPETTRARLPETPDTLHRILALDFSTYMSGSVLTKVDRASMAHGLEVRPPLLDNDMIDFAFSVPSSYKLRGKTTKYLFKRAATRTRALRHHRATEEGVRHSPRRVDARRAERADRRHRRSLARLGFGPRRPRLRSARGTASTRTKRADRIEAALGAARSSPLAFEEHRVTDKDHQGSPDRFGYEWASYSEVLPESKRQLERWLGATGLASFAGKRVMDVGCGMGRNPYWFMDAGATSVLAVDVDDGSLGAARREPRAVREREGREALGLRPRSEGRSAASIASPASASCTISPTRAGCAREDVGVRRARRSPRPVVLRQGGQPAHPARHPGASRRRLARADRREPRDGQIDRRGGVARDQGRAVPHRVLPVDPLALVP